MVTSEKFTDNQSPRQFEPVKDRGIIQELFTFLWENKLWWMIPIMGVIALLIIFILLGTQAGSAAPFIYTLF